MVAITLYFFYKYSQLPIAPVGQEKCRIAVEPLGKHRVTDYACIHWRGTNSMKTRDETRGIINGLVENARRDIKVFAPLLDPYYFNTAAVERGLTAFALIHSENRAQFLIEHVPALLGQARLLGLLRRLGARLEIRRVDENAIGLREFFVVADTHAYYRQNDYEILDGYTETDAPGPAALLVQRFAERWERSERIVDLQPTGL